MGAIGFWKDNLPSLVLSDDSWFLTAAGLLSGCEIQTCFEAACHAQLTGSVIGMILLAAHFAATVSRQCHSFMHSSNLCQPLGSSVHSPK